MKILLNVETDVYYSNGNYYNNSLSVYIPRYRKFCDELTSLSIVKEMDNPTVSQIDTDGVSFVSVEKINTVKRMLFTSPINDRIIKEAVSSSDICIVHLPSTNGNMVVKHAKAMGKPYMVVVVACIWDGLWNYDIRGKIMAPIRFLSARKAIRDAKYAIYVTNHFLQSRYPVRGESIGCSNVSLKPASESLLEGKVERLKERGSRAIVLSTLGSVGVKFKGQEYVIRAIAKLQSEGFNFEYHLAGGGDTLRLATLATKLGVSGRVKFYGRLPHEKVTDILDMTDIYIQPSKQEGLPRAVIEAMSRACPVIGSNIAGIPELLEPEYLFKAGDVDAICKLLRRLSVDDLTDVAARNLEESKKYDPLELNSRRDKFISEFIEYAKSKIAE